MSVAFKPDLEQWTPELPRVDTFQRSANSAPSALQWAGVSNSAVMFAATLTINELNALNKSATYTTLIPNMIVLGDTPAATRELHYSGTVRTALAAGAIVFAVAVVLAVANLIVPTSETKTAGLVAFLVGTALLALGLQQARRQLREFERP